VTLRALNVFLIKEQIPLVTLAQLKQIIAHQKLVAFELEVCDFHQTLWSMGAYTASNKCPVWKRVWPHETM